MLIKIFSVHLNKLVTLCVPVGRSRNIEQLELVFSLSLKGFMFIVLRMVTQLYEKT